jgi:hypothetical protein
MIRNILSNEAYIGNSVYNRKSFRLKQVIKKEPTRTMGQSDWSL